MNTRSGYVPPVPEPMLERGNDLDWENLPADPSDLNYRPALTVADADGRQILGMLFIAGFFASPFSMLFRMWLGPELVGTTPFTVALLCACLLGLKATCKGIREQKPNLREIWIWFVLPIQTWAMIALAPQTHSFAFALAYAAMMSLPPLFILSDEFATHAVHWFAASPAASVADMLAAQKAWVRRFDLNSQQSANPAADQGTPIHDAKAAVRHYIGGLKSLGLAVLIGAIPAIFLAANGTDTPRLGFWLFVTTSLSMAAMGLLACARGDMSLGLWWRVFIGWFTFGRDQFLPNWVFQTPSGSPLRRQMLLLHAGWCMALSWIYLTDHFTWFLTCDPAFAAAIGDIVPGPDQTGIGADYFLRGGQLAIFYFVVAIFVCAAGPAIFLILALFLATGRLIRGLSLVFEGAQR